MTTYDSFYDDAYDTREVHCHCCEQKDQKMDEASEFFEEVLFNLYGSKDFDSDNLEHCLHELAWLLGVRFSFGELKIQKKEEKKIEKPKFEFTELVKFNNDMLTQIAKGGI